MKAKTAIQYITVNVLFLVIFICFDIYYITPKAKAIIHETTTTVRTKQEFLLSLTHSLCIKLPFLICMPKNEINTEKTGGISNQKKKCMKCMAKHATRRIIYEQIYRI